MNATKETSKETSQTDDNKHPQDMDGAGDDDVKGKLVSRDVKGSGELTQDVDVDGRPVFGHGLPCTITYTSTCNDRHRQTAYTTGHLHPTG